MNRRLAVTVSLALPLLLAAAAGAAPPGRDRAGFGPGGGLGPGLGFGPGPECDGSGPCNDPAWHERMLERRGERLADTLDLSTEQRTRFAALRAAHLEAARPQHDALRTAAGELRSLLDQPDPDPAAVGDRVLEVRRLRGELAAAHDELERQLAELLTPEQRAALDRLERARPGRGDRFDDRLRRHRHWDAD